MLVMIQRLMSQVSDKYAKDHNEPLNETWILSELSQNFSLNSNSNLFSELNSSSNLLGSHTIDFSSQVFDNSNIGMSPLHRNMNANTGPTTSGVATNATSSPFKTNFNDHQSVMASTTPTNQNGGIESDIGINVKATNPFASDVYRIAFDNTLNTTTPSITMTTQNHNSFGGGNSVHSTTRIPGTTTSQLTSDLANNNKSTLIQ